MDPERWQRLSPLLDALLELEPHARVQRLQTLREEDAALAEEVAALIDLDESHADFLAQSPVGVPTGPAPGNVIGPYRLERLLGEGGMGQVWLAGRADGLYQRRVALKLLRPGLADTDLRLRFTREREILARLTHPHIARLLDAGVSQAGLPYLALEYVDGVPITDWCRDHHTALEVRLQMFHQICDAVSHAHANLIVHRDLKPSNILVTPAGDVRLLDFGIGKLLDHEAPVLERTRTGARAFTLHYAAPEQVRGEPVSTMTDVYSLGVVLYELLTDSKPYRPARKSDAAWEEAILTADPLRPSQTLQRAAEHHPEEGHALRRQARQVAGDLDNIVLKALAKRPEQRYPSVEALALDLRRHEMGRPVLARPDSVGYRMRKYVRRHRWALATGSLVAVVLVTALGLVAWQAREAVREASRAQAIQDFMLGVFENASVSHSGQPLDLRGLLDASLERGQRELARQPRARAELIGLVARLRIGLGDYNEARTLLERQAILVDGSPDIPDSLRLESLTQRGRVLRLLGLPRACIDLMQPALAGARREQAQLPSQVAEFYSQLGRCRRANGERQGARQLFERALAIRQDGAIGDRVGEVANLMDIANLHADEGNIATALRQLETARTQLREQAGARHPLLVEINRSIGSLHRARGELALAQREVAEALAISVEVNGENHPATIASRRQLAALQVESGRFRQARENLTIVSRQIASRLGASHPESIHSLVDLGQVEWQLGELDRALSTLQRAAVAARRHGGPALRADVALAQGSVLRDAGQPAAALPLLLQASRQRRQLDGENHPSVGTALLELGLAQQAVGDPGAQATLRNAATIVRAAWGPRHAETRNAAAAWARARVLGGDSGGRRELEALARPADPLPASVLARIRAGAYLAEAACRSQPSMTALAALSALRTPLLQWQPEGGSLTREVEAIEAGCRRRP